MTINHVLVSVEKAVLKKWDHVTPAQQEFPPSPNAALDLITMRKRHLMLPQVSMSFPK